MADLATETVLRLAQVPDIVGLKDATSDLVRHVELMKRLPRGREFALYSGNDDTALAFMLLGGHGVISVTANVAPKLMSRCARRHGGATFHGARHQRAAARDSHARLFVEANPIPVKWALSRDGADRRRTAPAAHVAVAAVSRCCPRRPGRRGMLESRARTMNRMMRLARPLAAWVTIAALALPGCETIGPVGKRIDYKSTSTAPALELPPELSQPRYDDRYAVSTASGLAAANAARPKQTDLLPTNSEAQIARAGNERWIVAKATPEQAWSTVRQFWTENGFVVAIEQPAIGVMETDWAENRADLRPTFCAARSASISTRSRRRTSATSSARGSSAAREARHRGDLRLASRDGAGADGADRQQIRRGLRVGADAAQSEPGGGNAVAANDAFRRDRDAGRGHDVRGRARRARAAAAVAERARASKRAPTASPS